MKADITEKGWIHFIPETDNEIKFLEKLMEKDAALICGGKTGRTGEKIWKYNYSIRVREK